MKKVFRMCLAAAIAAALTCAGIPLSGIERAEEVKAAAVSEDFVIDANGVLTRYKGEGGDVVIPAGVKSIGGHAFSDNRKLTSVVIPSGVTSIGDSAFRNCYGLKSVVIPNTVTSIGAYAFCVCNSLTSIEIPNSVTSIGASAFASCKSLTSIKIPASVKSIGSQAFSSRFLVSITVDKGNTVYDSRSNCNAIIHIESGELLTGCKNTKIPAGVKSIGNWAFYGATGLTKIEIPAGVTKIGEAAFGDCEGLRSVKIPDGVESLGYGVFSECENLKSIEIPASVKSIGELAFDKCSNLTIYGVPGSYAETYAKEYKPTAIPFVNITDKPEDPIIYGDLTDDGFVKLDDAQLALKIALRIVTNPTDDQIKVGDVMNVGDGIKLTDAQAILKRALRISIVFDAEKG